MWTGGGYGALASRSTVAVKPLKLIWAITFEEVLNLGFYVLTPNHFNKLDTPARFLF